MIKDNIKRLPPPVAPKPHNPSDTKINSTTSQLGIKPAPRPSIESSTQNTIKELQERLKMNHLMYGPTNPYVNKNNQKILERIEKLTRQK